MWDYKITLSSLFLGVFIVVCGYQALKFLPDRYYFSFSNAISGHQAASFFVSPPGISGNKRCEALKKFDLIKPETLGTSSGYFVFECAKELNVDIPGVDMSIEYYSQPLVQDVIDEKEPSLEWSTQVTNAYRNEGGFNFLAAFVLRMLPAALAGLTLAAAYREEALVAAPIACGISSFIFIWPTVIFWDLVVDQNWRIEKNLFFIMYGAYIILYAYTGKFFATLYLKAWIPLRKPDINVDWSKITTGAVQQIVTACIAAGLTMFAIR